MSHSLVTAHGHAVYNSTRDGTPPVEMVEWARLLLAPHRADTSLPVSPASPRPHRTVQHTPTLDGVPRRRLSSPATTVEQQHTVPRSPPPPVSVTRARRAEPGLVPLWSSRRGHVAAARCVPFLLARPTYGFMRANLARLPPPCVSIPPGNTQGSAPGGPETNLDISDFPALGSGISAAISTPSLLSSYASQAGTGLLPTTAAAGFLPNGAVLGNAPTGSVVPGNAREFSADDFPALGGFGGGEMGLGAANGQQSNGMSFLAGMGGGVGAGRTGAQEQASAVAALQHQQQQNQHRANLLGSMNGAAGQGQDGQQSRNVSGGPGFLAEGDKRVSLSLVRVGE